VLKLPNLTVHAANPIVGSIKAPLGVQTDVGKTGTFISIFVTTLVIIAGIWSLWQFLTAGLAFITSGGDENKIKQATSKINSAILGLVVIAASFIIAALLGWALFGKASTFLAPKLQTI